MKVLFHFDAGEQLRKYVSQLAQQDLHVACCPEGHDQPFYSELSDSEAIWHVLQPITAEIMDRAPRLKLIQKIGVGVNTIDLDAARERGISVCNMPGTNSQAVAEMTVLLMLSALRLQPRIDKVCRGGQWVVDKLSQESFGEICGRTVGFVGFGEVPQRLAPVLAAMGAEVIYTATQDKNLAQPFVALDELLASADIVSLHVPLTTSTEKLLNAKRIRSMKLGAILVNTARGQLVDEEALYQALKSRQLRAAGLDVFDQEPAISTNPLLALDNVAVAPHIAWLTMETFARSITIAADNSLSIMYGKPLLHQVM